MVDNNGAIKKQVIGVERTGNRSRILVAISNIAGNIDEAHDYKTDAVTATNREPGVAIAFVETA